jgi:hypothetical protein
VILRPQPSDVTNGNNRICAIDCLSPALCDTSKDKESGYTKDDNQEQTNQFGVSNIHGVVEPPRITFGKYP